MMYPYSDHMSRWGYALGIIGMVLFWAVLVPGVRLPLGPDEGRDDGRHGRGCNPASTA